MIYPARGTCILPPDILERIARNGNDQQRDWALQTLARDHSLRAIRMQNAALKLRLPRVVNPLTCPVAGESLRTIFNANNTENLPGTVVRQEGAPATGDEAVDEAYEGLGDTYKFFFEAYDRDSIDDEGMKLDGTVHYGSDYPNAFWDGERMVFGDGDGQIFNRFTISLDVIGHELGHGVTEDEAGLVYWQQPGALNESMSDVFGSLVKQFKRGQKSDEADWLIGEGLLAQGINGVALRSMKEPGTAYDDPLLGKDPQPGHMDQYVETTADNGGVHINSGIPNHAFYVAATTLGGFAWERVGRIWYEALRDPRLRTTARFRTFARATVRAATRLYPETADEVQAVKTGWSKVGINV